jgi:hypothetical protein
MANSSHLRAEAEQALRLARDSADPAAIENHLQRAAQSWGRADAIDLLISLRDVAAALDSGEHLPRRYPAREVGSLWLDVAGIEPGSAHKGDRTADCCALLLAGSASARR